MISMPRLVAAMAAMGHVTPAKAQLLGDFLHDAVTGNPRIAAATAAVAAARAQVDIAQAAARPNLGVDGTVNWTRQSDLGLANDQIADDSNTRLAFAVPLYSGGEVRHGVAAARWRARVADTDRRQAIEDVLVATVEAYAGLARDEVVVDLRQGFVTMLEEEQRRVAAEIRAAQATRTDLFQTHARLAGARADLATAGAQRETSLETLQELTGRYPARRVDLPDTAAQDRLIPAALALDDDRANDATDLAGASDRLEAARADIGVARSGRLPRLSLDVEATYGFNVFRDRLARYGLTGDPSRFSTTGIRLGLSLRVPLSQGGALGARIRRSAALANEAVATRTGTQRLALLRLRRDRARFVAIRDSIAAFETAVARNAEAVRGVRIDRRLGFRSTLEVLNAEQELLDSGIQLAARRAELIGGAAALLRDAGRGAELAEDFPRALAGRRMAQRPVAASLARSKPSPFTVVTSFDLADLPGAHVTRAAGPQIGYDYRVADAGSSRDEATGQRLRYQSV